MRILLAGLLYATSGMLAALGLLLLKGGAPDLAAGRFTREAVLLFGTGFLVYGLSFLCFTAVLWWQRLGAAYPIAVGVTVLSSFAVSLYWLNEPWGWRSVAGAVLILGGILLVGYQPDPAGADRNPAPPGR